MPIDTKKAARRELSFHCTGCLKEELARIEAAEAAGTLACTGNWTPGEILDHVALTWEFAFDGWPAEAKPPFWMRLFGRLLKKRVTSGATTPAGIRLPKEASFLMPTPGAPFGPALARLRAVLDRIDRGEQATATSPMFGPMTHDESTRLNLGHAQLHLGFVTYAGA